GKPQHFDAKTFFAGSEYLQIYEPLDDSNLEAFLSRNAVRERRVDNVASAFVWLQHLAEECFANPTNVGLGIVEWYVDHAGSFWQDQGNELLGNYLASLKVQIDDMRVAWAPRLRWPLADVILRGLYAAQRSDKPSTETPASGATGAPKGTTGQSIQPTWP